MTFVYTLCLHIIYTYNDFMIYFASVKSNLPQHHMVQLPRWPHASPGTAWKNLAGPTFSSPLGPLENRSLESRRWTGIWKPPSLGAFAVSFREGIFFFGVASNFGLPSHMAFSSETFFKYRSVRLKNLQNNQGKMKFPTEKAPSRMESSDGTPSYFAHLKRGYIVV